MARHRSHRRSNLEGKRDSGSSSEELAKVRPLQAATKKNGNLRSSKRKMTSDDSSTGNNSDSVASTPRKRERSAVPFSPRPEVNNRMGLRHSNKKRSSPMGSRNASNPLNSLSPPRPGKSFKGVMESNPKKRTLESAKDEANKRIKKFETATARIAQNIQDRKQQRGDASGIIKSIKMYNFMCHQSFEQKWHPNINFIIGENGSGKSALLSALMIGLGGKALSTARTSSVKDLIKTGATHAKTVIVLLNKGKLPVEQYGEEISIQRIIDHKGHSNYKIQYGADAKFKPATKQELDNLLRLLNIQLENPVVVLNQEYARSFLRSKDPKDKYKLFEDGTGIGECDKMQVQVQETLQEIDATLEKKKQELQSLKKSKEELEEKIEMIEGISGHQAKLRELDAELSWRRVESQEKEDVALRKELQKANKKLEDLEISLKTSLDKKKELEKESASPMNKRHEQMQQKRDCEKQESEIQTTINALTKEKVHIEMRVKGAKSLLPRKKEHLMRVEGKIKSNEEKVKGDRDKEMNKYLQAKADMEEKIAENERSCRTLKEEKDRFAQGATSLKQKIDETKRHRYSVEAQIADKDRQLKQMEKMASSYAVFGSQMITLMEKINQSRRQFSQRPRGPLGACITVKDAAYVDIIQFVLKSKIADFVVNNTADAKVLNNLIFQVYGRKRVPGVMRPNVTCLPFSKAYDCSQRNASRGLAYPTILDMLEIDNNDDIVKNALLDVANVERLLLFKTQSEALDLLSYRENVPKSCMGGYTLDFFQVIPDPNLRINPLPLHKTQKLIKSSRVSQKRNLQLEIETLKDELQNFIVSPEMIEDERKLRHEERKRDEEFREKRNLVAILKQQHSNLREPPNRLADMASMVEELEEIKADISRLSNEASAYEETLAETLTKISEQQALKREISSKIDRIDKEIMRTMENQDKHKERVDRMDAYIMRFKRSVDKAKEDVDSLSRNIATATAKLAEATSIALGFGERVSNPRHASEIKGEYDSIKVKIDQLQKFKVRHSTIKERYKVVHKRYNKYASDLNFVCDMHAKVVKYYQTVCVRYAHAKTRCIQALTKCYEEIASARKYHGKIEIDHEARELFYLICPDKESLQKISKHEKNRTKYKSKMIEYAAGLSGGERSFSTICFIIAMWQAMKTPFYMLDEFDVFMDAQNRTVSQEALINHAKNFPHNQFFFFTPLDLTIIPTSDEATVLRLFPPDRGQNRAAAPAEALPDPANVPSTSQNRKRGRGSN